MSSEIFLAEKLRKFIAIFPETSENFLKNIFRFIRFNYNHIEINNKHVFDRGLQIFVF